MTAAVRGDHQSPFGQRQSRAQIRGLLKLLGRRPRRVLDLGCGAGRVLGPLARAGHAVMGVDRSAEVLRMCEKSLGRLRNNVELIQADFMRRLPNRKLFDAVLCLGNTFMTNSEIDQATRLMARIGKILKPRGMFIIDDLPRTFWPELTSGNWQAGLSPDGAMQMVWHESDAILTIRHGRDIDRRHWKLKPGDKLLRLWCDGSLRVAAAHAGLSAPVRINAAALLVFKRAALRNSRASRRRG